MKAIILAAGIGNRLGEHAANKPKSMLEFDGKSLLQRHIEILLANQIHDITIVTGYESALLEEPLKDSRENINFINNPHYTEGSIISLNCARDVLLNEPHYILMDADVLYDQLILERLINTNIDNCFLLDQDFIHGDEPVKLCINEKGHIIEFRKQLADDLDYKIIGESVGFFKFNKEIGKLIVNRIEDYLSNADNDAPYEEVLRDLLLEDPKQFGYEDITGLSWIEIDFPEDIMRAETEILPRLSQNKMI